MRYFISLIHVLLIITSLSYADKKHTKTIPFESNLILDIDPFIQNIVNQVSGDSILVYLQQLESLGLKYPGTTALENTRDWLFSKYQSYGYNNIAYHDFNYSSFTLQNIIVTKTGITQPDVTLIIDGHYDTVGGPGVNDNGSGVAVILEIARLLSNIECEYTIKFINFSAEEQGLIGSQAYVTNVVVPQSMNILLVFNIDEVGGIAGYINDTITCERDQDNQNGNDLASAAYTDTLATLTQEYSSLNTQIAHAWGSDYIPFENAGYVITGYYETNESPYPHTNNDSLSNMDPAYVTEITKGAVAAALYFARAKKNLNYYHSRYNKEENLYSQQCQLYPASPNPFNETTTISYKLNISNYIEVLLYNVVGQKIKELYSGFQKAGQYQIELKEKDLSSGRFYIRLKTRDYSIYSSILLLK